ncbi:MAG: LacI family DNA-binding transcriptional regulator [Jatrophihabitantaceae bacterium]
MTSRPTIADVARRAGVSKGAVSFALNDRGGVSSETRARILDAAEELGWRPSRVARSLSVSRAFTVGLVVARAAELLGADPFFPSFIAGVESVLAPAGHSLLLQVVPSAEAEEAGYRTLAAEGRVDGVFLSDLRAEDHRIAVLSELGLCAVTLNRPDIASPFPAVCVDDRQGVRQAVEHLLDLGHVRIGYVCGPLQFVHSRHRRDAWAAALQAAGVDEGPLVVADFTAAGGAAATGRLLDLDAAPTAIVYANDVMAIAGLGVAAKRGLRVPRDLSVVGFDGTELAAHLHPPLTTVSTDPFGWGQVAALTLLRATDPATRGDHIGDVELPPAQLQLGGSTAKPYRRRSVARAPAIPTTRPESPPLPEQPERQGAER